MCIAFVCYPGCDVMDFEINLIFLMEPVFLHDQKVMTKNKFLENEMSFQGEIKSIFHQFLKGFQLSKIVSDLRVRLLMNSANFSIDPINAALIFY